MKENMVTETNVNHMYTNQAKATDLVKYAYNPSFTVFITYGIFRMAELYFPNPEKKPFWQ
jgi:hypothetical protein